MTATRTRSSAPLAAAWLLTALVVAPVGFLLFALSETDGDRALGLALALGGVLAGVTGAACLATGGIRRRWSLALSGGLVLLGLFGAAVALTETPSFVEDALLLGLPPAVGGLLTAALALRRSGDSAG